MWNLISCKPHLKIEKKKEEDKKLRRNLLSAKSTIDNKPPLQFNHIKKKVRKQRLEEGNLHIEKYRDIDIKNRLLLEKILSKRSDISNLMASAKFYEPSSNKITHNHLAIQKNNRKLLEKLHQASTSYPLVETEKWHQDMKKLKLNISKNAGRIVMNKNRSASQDPIESQTVKRVLKGIRPNTAKVEEKDIENVEEIDN